MQTPENGVKGRIHSFLSMGAVDGPGLRYVVFLQGCPLRCACCHNPDTWNAAGGTEYTVEDVLRRVRRCKPYIYESGGVTVTGGEPLAQPVFTAALLKALRAEGYGDMITETVNANSLSSFVKEQIAENGDELPGWLRGLVNVFEKTTVGVRKAR